MFSPLTERDAELIVRLEVEALRKRVAKLGYTLRVTPAALRELAQRGFSQRYGARAIRRTVVEQIEERIATLLVGGELSAGVEISVGAIKGEFRISTKGVA